MNPKPRVIAFAIATATIVALNLSMANASGVVAGATEPTQIMNNIELVASNVKEAEQISNQLTQIANQIQAYQNMVTNTLNIPNQIWQNADGLLQQLVGVINQGQALAFSATNINSLFQQKYPGYTPPQDFAASYQQLNETTLDSIRGALNAANLQSNEFTSEQGALNAIEAQSQTAQGRMQAIQAGNQIAMAQVQQMRKMRALQMAQMQAQAAYMDAQTQQKANDDMITQQTLNFTVTPMDTRSAPQVGQ
ncbi:P-type conjugative transfer protein TrbJ [Halothiobacillus neapolitanus]|uniref:P-type conjugative transfer protein TrbJ n=1 Tax=Halothiobacillus neapolitanus (strain ATCC 23641 / DSM 15147 / CIP 104769 / NCIMB 8539 / c2) TaxID=555778 RepID=D0L171_HALNC|nr:P-type conjugative transfer protein TrbJ [Halothiobacillus neapolitanus]ACX96444.1 P-type conjugative transfer protein TrbJ [Halothiobacillus neapolitanus c2]TDN66759.1 P-type conjugative transfer protein TrbJ [Halothiobacillus neapolitanus]